MGEDKIAVLLQESLAVAVNTGAMAPRDTRRVIVDTTVQPKNVMFPTDAKLLNRAREKLVTLASKMGLGLRQSYTRVGKLALIMQQRYAHAKQFKRAGKALRTLRTCLGRTMRDIGRQIAGDEPLQAIFKRPLYLAGRVLEQRREARGRKVYSLHAPEVECIGPFDRLRRKSPRALRVRRQSVGRRHAAPLQGRPVRAACQGAAGQPL